jgi:hypothetical protein
MFKSKLLPMMMLTLAFSAQALRAEDKDADAQSEKEKKICRTEKATGSRTRVTRICMTQSQWDNLAQNTARSVENMNRQQNRPDRGATNPLAGF